jgi:hypothetical protein
VRPRRPGAPCRRAACRCRGGSTGESSVGSGPAAPRACASDAAGAAGGPAWRAGQQDRRTPGGAGRRGAPPPSAAPRWYRCGPCPRGWPAERARGPGRKADPRGRRWQPARSQGQRPSTQTTRSSRSGARAFRHGSGPACLVGGSRIAPSWFNTPRDMRRACKSRPQETLGGLVSHRLRSPPSGVGCPAPAVPPWYAEEGASIRINGLQATAYSVRSAPASRHA